VAREIRELAVLFADITDSTTLYRRLGDLHARAVVNDCLTLAADALARCGGRVVKTLGDELLCVCPDADAAVLAASAMQSAVRAGRPGDQALRLHIGLHAGPVVVEGDDVFGDTVNAAAYLTAMATAGQVLTTEAIELGLSAALKPCVRPIFRAPLKGSTRDATVFQVLWQADRHDMTDVNLSSAKALPGDAGSLLVGLHDERVSIDQWRTEVVVGREVGCDLVIADRHASRRHVSIRLVRTHFYLFDHSTNGTFVALDNGDEVHVLRRELLLDGAGEIRVGRSRAERPADVVTYARDRRSIFRV